MQEIPRQGDRGFLLDVVLRAGASLQSAGFHMANFARCAVQVVADDGVAQRGEMDADLVSASCINGDVEQGKFPPRRIDTLTNAVMADGFTALEAARGHASATNAVATDGGIDGSGILLEPAVREGNVGLLHLAAGELRGQFAMGDIVFRHDDQTACFLVETVNDDRPESAAHAGQTGEVVQECVDEGAAVAFVVGGAGAGVDHHAGGFVDDGQIIVFVDDIERDVFSDRAQGNDFGCVEDGDVLVAAEAQGGLGGGVVYQDFFFGDELLYARATEVGEVGDEKLVETLAGVFGGDLKVERENHQLKCKSARARGPRDSRRDGSATLSGGAGDFGAGGAADPKHATGDDQEDRDQLGAGHGTTEDGA